VDRDFHPLSDATAPRAKSPGGRFRAAPPSLRSKWGKLFQGSLWLARKAKPTPRVCASPPRGKPVPIRCRKSFAIHLLSSAADGRDSSYPLCHGPRRRATRV